MDLYYWITIATVDGVCGWNAKLDPRGLSHVKVCLKDILISCDQVG